MDSRSTRARTLWKAQREFVRELAALSRQQAGACGLSAAQGEALLLLAEAGTLKMLELADALGVAPSSATRLIQQLVQDDLAAREPDPDDRRAVIVRATAPGLQKADELHAVGYADAWELVRAMEGGGVPAGALEGAVAVLRSWRRRREDAEL